MSDLYHGEYPVDMTPAEAKAEVERRRVERARREAAALKGGDDCPGAEEAFAALAKNTDSPPPMGE